MFNLHKVDTIFYIFISCYFSSVFQILFLNSFRSNRNSDIEKNEVTRQIDVGYRLSLELSDAAKDCNYPETCRWDCLLC